jgi:large subunit ribosomal protein L15
MQLNELKPRHKSKERRTIGRGGKKGAYSGKGVKGQRARSGHKFEPFIRSLIKRYPKLRGYRFKKDWLEPETINVRDIEKRFFIGENNKKGEKNEIKISPEVLLEKRLIRKIEGRMPKVKILGKGTLTKAMMVEGCEVSKEAKEKIEKAGGKIKK